MSSVRVLGNRRSAPREAIIQVIRQAAHAMSPPEIHRRALSHHSGLGIATVYRTLNALVAAGAINEVRLPGESAARYEAAAKAHHHYFRCRNCDRLIELPGCVPLTNLLPPGFRMIHHEIVLYGLCDQCPARSIP